MLAREAYDSVCARIAQMYEQDGWKYAKSGHRMTKKTKAFTYQVHFYTGYYNISEKDVAFYGYFGISMNKPKQDIWGLGTQDSGVPHGRLEWNVATENMWADTIKEFTHWLEAECFPVMNECENNLDEFVGKVAKQGFYPPSGYNISIEFLLKYGSKELVDMRIPAFTLHRGSDFNQITIQIVETNYFLSPTMFHQFVNISNGGIQPFQFFNK